MPSEELVTRGALARRLAVNAATKPLHVAVLGCLIVVGIVLNLVVVVGAIAIVAYLVLVALTFFDADEAERVGNQLRGGRRAGAGGGGAARPRRPTSAPSIRASRRWCARRARRPPASARRSRRPTTPSTTSPRTSTPSSPRWTPRRAARSSSPPRWPGRRAPGRTSQGSIGRSRTCAGVTTTPTCARCAPTSRPSATRRRAWRTAWSASRSACGAFARRWACCARDWSRCPHPRRRRPSASWRASRASCASAPTCWPRRWPRSSPTTTTSRSSCPWPSTDPTGERLAHMMRRVRSRALAIACVIAGLLLAAPAGASAATSLTIGTGHKPGVAVDAAGTAYIAWYGPESNTTSLNFCRLPRGAGACDVRTTIAAPGTTLSRPFVTVDGATVRVVSYRYGLTGVRFDQIWEFTSADGGATFDAGHPVGIAPFDEGVRGPGDTLTVATNAESTGLGVQNVPLDGSDAGESQAILSADHPYNGTVGLAGPTMVAVFADASSNAQVRTSAGALNDAASWTPPVDIGYADYPRLAGGPSGLFLLSGTPENALTVRKFDGATFSAGV